MGFSCLNELELRGGSPKDREAAAALILALDSVDEEAAARTESADELTLRFPSVDDVPEGTVDDLSGRFPELALSLCYFSLDGEFYGYALRGPAGSGGDSADFGEDTRAEVGTRYDGDGIAFVKATYSLRRRGA